MDAQLTRDVTNRASLSVECEDCLMCLHREYIGHAGGNDSGFPGTFPSSGLAPGVVEFEGLHFDPRWYNLSDR